jgi:probable F420-dependent oxidoreductase
MDHGVALFATDYSIQPAQLARLVEERDFESLWFTEHTHTPVSRATPYPGGGELPREYSRTYDPFVALSFAAAATERIKLGTGVCLVIERDPIVLAKQAASLDRLSGGRFQLGVGAGWNREEMRNHGTDPDRRFRLMRERVEAIKQIWTSDEAEYHGELVDFDPIWCWPKPLQAPHPPVLIGGSGPRVLDRVLAYADGWMPDWDWMSEQPDSVQALTERVRKLRERAGRHVPVTLFGVEPEARAVEPLAAAGVDRAVYYVSPDDSPGEVERMLDGVVALR